ncbi:hypothetical protein EB796_003450 [Bugula neritina]|uniref:Uncharacterized protein n=1 Tax=Bugula neritina TaxID=10212 RepID=A0A7J7KJ42_BUGNE|nr:hypothetical protein EB796_003450 [Bugula neritina]
MCILEKEFFDCAEEIVEEYFDALEQLEDGKPTLPQPELNNDQPDQAEIGKLIDIDQNEVTDDDQSHPLLPTVTIRPGVVGYLLCTICIMISD